MPDQHDQTTVPARPHQTGLLVTAWGVFGALAVAILVYAEASLFVMIIAVVIWLAWGCAAQLV